MDGDTARSSRVGMSPERSKSDLRMSPRKTPTLQRSHSSPITEPQESGGKPRSKSMSEAGAKSYRPLQGQLSQIEGETQVIREQTEVSHFTDRENTELSKLSEKADLADLRSELTLPADIAEEETIEDHVETPKEVSVIKEDVVEVKVEEEVVEEDKTEVLNEDQVDEGAEPKEPEVKTPDEVKSLTEVKSQLEVSIPSEGKPEEIPVEVEEEVEVKEEEAEVEVKQLDEVVTVPGGSDDDAKEKSGEVTPVEKALSHRSSSQKGSVVEDDVKGIPTTVWKQLGDSLFYSHTLYSCTGVTPTSHISIV